MKSSSAFALIAVCAASSSSSSAMAASSILKGDIGKPRNTAMLKRMLQKAENNNSNSNKNKKDDTPNSPPSTTPTTPTVTPTASSAYYSGILLDTQITNNYIYNAPISITFELNNNLTGISTETLLRLNVSHVNDWEFGVFMRMADPQGGALEPIFAVKPTSIVNKNAAGGSSRKLQELDANLTAAEAEAAATEALAALAAADAAIADANNSTDGDSTLPDNNSTDPTNNNTDIDLGPIVPPIVNYVGSAQITTTDATILDPNLYGTGFDIYFLDEHGAAILGPATFYMIATEAMKEKEQAEIDFRPKHGLVNHDGSAKGSQSKTSKVNVDKAKKEKDTKAQKDMGYGSGTDGGMVLATREALANYILITDSDLYETNATVTVTYDIGVVEETTRRQRRRMANLFAGGSGKTTTTTTTATTVAAGTTTTTKGTTAASTTTTTTTPKGKDKTTTTVATTVTTTTSGVIVTPPDQPTTDGEDIKLYTMGVYMRMVRYHFYLHYSQSFLLLVVCSPLSTSQQLHRHTPKMDHSHPSSPSPSALHPAQKHPRNLKREHLH